MKRLYSYRILVHLRIGFNLSQNQTLSTQSHLFLRTPKLGKIFKGIKYSFNELPNLFVPNQTCLHSVSTYDSAQRFNLMIYVIWNFLFWHNIICQICQSPLTCSCAVWGLSPHPSVLHSCSLMLVVISDYCYSSWMDAPGLGGKPTEYYRSFILDKCYWTSGPVKRTWTRSGSPSVKSSCDPTGPNKRDICVDMPQPPGWSHSHSHQ